MTENPYILQWFNREISDEILKQNISESDFAFCMQLKNATDNLSVENVNLDANFNAIKQKMAEPKLTKTNNNPWLRYASVAAVLVLFVGIYQLFFFSQKTIVAKGDSKTLLLPDKSVVVINSNSEVAYPTLFQVNRKIKLEGEAYFEVEKGSVFKVITPNGVVQVLGTKFNVTSYPNWFEVTCFEGKVEVKSDNQTTTLTPGISVRKGSKDFEQMQIFDENPKWVEGESTFKSVPLSVVFLSFKNRFGKNVVLPKKFENLKFTGTFVHNDIEKALKSICNPVGLQYSIEQNKINLTEMK